MNNRPQDWWEVRLLSPQAGLPRWVYLAGPLDEEAAHSYVDNARMYGRTLAIVRVSVWSEVTL